MMLRLMEAGSVRGMRGRGVEGLREERYCVSDCDRGRVVGVKTMRATYAYTKLDRQTRTCFLSTMDLPELRPAQKGQQSR